MSKEREIRIGIKTLIGGITYDGAAVPFYDITRDDGKNPQIYVALIDSNYIGNKSKNLYKVMLHLGVKHQFDATYAGSKVVDAIGDDLETALEAGISIAGWTNVVQFLQRSFYAESSNKTVKDLIKLYIYELIIEDNG